MFEIICVDYDEDNSLASIECSSPGTLDGIESLFNQDQVFVDQVNFLASREFICISWTNKNQSRPVTTTALQQHSEDNRKLFSATTIATASQGQPQIIMCGDDQFGYENVIQTTVPLQTNQAKTGSCLKFSNYSTV